MHLKKPITLPCGAILQNRIAKSAMCENMSPKDHAPNKELIHAYERWTNGGPGLMMTGNIMIDARAIGEPGNIIIEDRSNFELLSQWANVVKDSGIHLWPQLNHPGRQALSPINKEVVAPSSVSTNIKGMSFLFKKPRTLTESEIEEIIDRFGTSAEICKEAGFTGVQIHGAHGYLVSQFLSPLTNQRKDKWGVSLENRMRFVLEIYRNIRSRVGDQFPIGIKINSADFQRGGFSEDESMEVVKILASEGMDLIEISGGTYERPAMIGSSKKKSTREREAYFLDYVEKVRKFINTPLMLTGGFRTTAAMEQALNQGALDIVGIARPFTLYPELPRKIFDGSLTELYVPNPKIGIKVIDKSGFVDIMWHEIHIRRLGQGKRPNPDLKASSIIAHNFTTTMQKLLFGLPIFRKNKKRGF